MDIISREFIVECIKDFLIYKLLLSYKKYFYELSSPPFHAYIYVKNNNNNKSPLL